MWQHTWLLQKKFFDKGKALSCVSMTNGLSIYRRITRIEHGFTIHGLKPLATSTPTPIHCIQSPSMIRSFLNPSYDHYQK